jgi:outer membrane protein assembly factor BamB
MKAELGQAALINGRSVSVDGFDVTFLYNTGNDQRRIACQAFADAWNNLGSQYHVNVVGVGLPTFLSLMASRSMPGYSTVWLADFADAADFAGTYMASSASSWFSYLQGPPYPADQAIIDAEVTQAATERDVAARVNEYRDLEYRYWNDCISISLDQPVGRRFARDWVQGWYYNPLLPGLYAYDLYKFPPVPSGTASGTDWWPMFHHALNHTGYSTSTRAPNTNQVLWNYLTGWWVCSSPAVFNGILYIGSGDWNVYALNAATGALIWNYTTNAPVYSSPAVADGKVYVGTGDTYTYTRNGIPGIYWIGGIYCLNALTGSVIWSNTTLGFPVESSPAVDNGMVFIGGCDTSSSGNVYAYNANTGATVWSCPTGGWVKSSPAVSGGVVFVGSNGTNDVYALNEFTGSVVWTRALGGPVVSSPAVANGMVYVGVCTMSNTVYALNEFTGATIWYYNTGSWVESSPAVFGGVVFVGCDNWYVYALDASTGAFIWRFYTVGIVTSSPAVADGKVYVGSWNGYGNAAPAPFYCLNASTGAYIWSYQTNSAFFDGSAAIVGGVVYVGACQPDNHVYAFESSTTVQAYCLTQAAYVNVAITLDGSPTGFTTPHTFTSLSTARLGTHTITVPKTDLSGHSFKNWNTGETTPTITVSIAGFTYIAYYSVRYDVAVTNLVCSKTVVGQGYTLYITVTVENQGDVTETFNVTAYYNGTAILVEEWPGGANSQIFWSNGDVNRDGYIDNWDLYTIQNAFGSRPGDSRWNPDADLNNDGVVNAYDIVTCSENYGKDIWTSLGLPKLIQSQRAVTLSSGNSANVTFRWKTTGVVYGNYTISAYAWSVPGEIDTADNTFIDGTIYVSIPGDIKRDGTVNIYDAILLANAYNSTPGSPNWNPNADIDGDGIVSIYDAIILANNYGKTA